jgi:hypothetical protein
MESEFQTSLRSIGARVVLTDLSFDSAGRIIEWSPGRRPQPSLTFNPTPLDSGGLFA